MDHVPIKPARVGYSSKELTDMFLPLFPLSSTLERQPFKAGEWSVQFHQREPSIHIRYGPALNFEALVSELLMALWTNY